MKKNNNINRNRKTRMAAQSAATKRVYKQSNKNSNNAIVNKLLIAIVLFIVAIVFVFASGAFDISEIIIEGNSTISNEQIISFSGIENGTNLFAISKKDITNNLKENSYINDVTIKRVFPDKIKLIIDERKLEFALQLANSYVYIDRQGYVLSILSESPKVPIILGLKTDLSNIKENDRLNDEDLNKMNTVINIMETAKNNDLSNLITKIDISDKSNYTIYLDGEGKIAYLGDGSDLNTRFLYIKSILKEQQGKAGEIFVNVDLNSEYVFFRENI